MKPREFEWRGFYPKYSRYVNLREFLSAYTTSDAICNAINSLELMSGPASKFESEFDATDSATILNRSHLSAATDALIFNNTNLSAAKAAAILDYSAFSISKVVSVLAHSNVTSGRAGEFFEDAHLSISRINSIIIHTNISDSRAQEILNETDWAIRDLTSASAILYAIHDEWTDAKLSDRDNRDTTPATILGANEFAQKFRPEWTISDGAPTATLGYFAYAGQAYIPSSFIIGTWQAYLSAETTVGYPIVSIMATRTTRDHSANEGYAFYQRKPFLDPEFQRLSRVDNGVLTVIIGTNNGWHTDYKVTRDADANFEFFRDAVSLGTTTDNTYTTSINLVLEASSSLYYIDNLKVW